MEGNDPDWESSRALNNWHHYSHLVTTIPRAMTDFLTDFLADRTEVDDNIVKTSFAPFWSIKSGMNPSKQG
jgi:hypothetical protein